MKKLFYLPEGDIEDPLNYSGTPHYLGVALKQHAAENGMLFQEIDTKYIINTEDIWRMAKQMLTKEKVGSLDEYLTSIQMDFPPNRFLILKIISASSYLEVLDAVKEYDRIVTHHVDELLMVQYHKGDCILSLNPYNPLFSLSVTYYLYLDTSLFEFYFLRPNGFLSFLKEEAIREYYFLLEKQAIEKASGIFTFSKACKMQLAQLYPVSLAEVVYAGVNFDTSELLLGECKQEPFRFLFVGRDFELKGGNLVLDAFRRLDLHHTKLTIITNNSAAEALQTQLSNSIQILGIQSKKEMINHYRQHHVLLFPTKIDAFGLVCCEAMFYGLLVIGSDYFAVPEIIGEENQTFIIKQDDSKALSEAMSYVYHNYRNLHDLIQKNQRRANDLFHWNGVSTKILKAMSDSNE